MIWLIIVIPVCYAVALGLLYYGHQRVSLFSSESLLEKHYFSVVVPFRNEAKNLPELLKSLQQLNYPTTHFELLLINDASSDNSEAIVHNILKGSAINYKILQNTPNQSSPKKTAITLAIHAAQFSWIVTTDADCTVPKNWLHTLNIFIQKTEAICVAMPVDYHTQPSFLHTYQQLDNWSLQAVTIGSFGLENPLLSNGANFAYTKDAFHEVNGFKDNLHIASGDDMFLLEKFKLKFPKKIAYLKSEDAIVSTLPVNSWRQLSSQRVRWASKTSQQKSIATKALGLLVFLNCIFILISPIVMIYSTTAFVACLTGLLIKLLADFLFMRCSSTFFGKKIKYYIFFISTFIYAVLTIYVVFSSLFSSYTWKQRSYRM